MSDRYRATRLIGSGGFGRTFLAVDEHIPSQPFCVIKQFFPKNLSAPLLEKATELFRQEAMRLDELGQHPQIPKLLAHFTQAPYQYLVQSFIDGQDLSQELAVKGAFSEDKIRELLNSLLPLLQFIHDRRVIHRDIKPANIIRRSGDGQLVLVDFGASKFTSATTLHHTGTIIGSAEYTAPEQVGGKAVFASDLYSLGVTCIHLLTHVPPFDLYSFADGAWFWQDCLPEPISDQLAHVLNRMLEPATNQRYPSAAIALKALNTSPQVAPHQPPPPPPIHASLFTTPSQAASAKNRAWQCLHTLHGHTKSIAAVAVSPNGKLLASAGFDRTIKLWHLGTGALVSEFNGHAQPVLALVFSLDGQTLISGSVDDTIKRWHIASESLLYTLTDNAAAVLSLSIALSPDGQTLVSGSDDHTVKLWHLETGKLFRTIVHPRGVTSVALSPDGQILASGSSDNLIRVWNFFTGEQLQTLSGHTRDINTVLLSADGKTLASGSGDHKIKLWELETGRTLKTLIGHLDWITALALSPNGQILASASNDCTLKLWNIQTGELIQTLTEHRKGVNAIAFCSDSQTLISGSSDCTLKIWRYQ